MIRYHKFSEDAVGRIAAAPRCRRSLEERMADDMRELAFADQNVDEQALIQRGWTLPTVRKLAPAAISIARRQSIRQGARHLG